MIFMLKVTYDILFEQEKEPTNISEPLSTPKGIEYIEIL